MKQQRAYAENDPMQLHAAVPQISEQDDWEALWESESLICQWLATLFSAELDAATLARYREGEAAPLLAHLRETHGLEAETERLERALAGLVMFPAPQLELAADFAGLFLTDARIGAPPYASLYAERAFLGQAAERMAVRLSAAGYTVKSDLGEPADHLAVMLDYLAARCQSLVGASKPDEVGKDIKTFMEQELCTWLPAFVLRCKQVATASDFYPALAVLTAAYIRGLCSLRGPLTGTQN
mgnify:FL=1